MSLTFDERGNLEPYRKIELTLVEFEENFVTGFPLSATRNRIFEQYKKFLKGFKAEIIADFVQWINGSFVTKKTQPCGY